MSSNKDQRSGQAAEYRKWYSTPQWKATRQRQLAAHPLCSFCAELGRVTIAAVCDHVEPHKGDPDKFWHLPFQSLCVQHHNCTKQRDERLGYSTAVGDDGWPIDVLHPSNRGNTSIRRRDGRS